MLDTHALVWWLTDSRRLSEPVRRVILDPANDKLISAATAWEIATKHGLGRLPQADALTLDLAGTIARQDSMSCPYP